MSQRVHRFAPSPMSGIAKAALLLVVAACGAGAKDADTTSTTAMTPAPASSDSIAGQVGMDGMKGMASMTGDPDRDFLRMMTDHHKGLILMAHMTKARKEGGAVVATAAKMDAKQDAELDKMTTMLEKEFKDAYAPKVMAEHQAMADALQAKTGKEYDRTFLESVVKHHEQAITMIEEYLPRARNSMLKQMAQTMKTDQTTEIGQLKQQLSKLGT